jgi:RNA polymerase sigma factor (sigma-70 family)
VPHAVPTVKGARAPASSPANLLAVIHERHGQRLLRLALRLAAGHRADAEELLQGAYERALLAPEPYLADPEGALFRLADALRDRARVLHRRAWREEPADLAGWAEVGDRPDDVDAWRGWVLRRRAGRERPQDLAGWAGAREPHDELERAEERDLLLGALAELRPAERRTLTLVAAGYRQTEIARTLGLSEACVAKTAERGRASLGEGRRALAAGERCRRMERLAPAYLAGTLIGERRRALERHLHSCRAACPRTFARLRAERARGPAPGGALAA